MFNNLTSSLTKIFDAIRSKGILTEEDLSRALREIRIALLEADVSLPVVKEFVEKVKEKAIGQEIVKSISPGQMVVKIVNDELIEILSSDSIGLDIKKKPSVIMVVGLQGSGKTTSCAKIANYLRTKQGKNSLLASLDIYRPAAQEQLSTLASQINMDIVPIIRDQKPLEIAKRALDIAATNQSDVVILDTAGRLHIDDELMLELAQIKALANPTEILLVADSMTGQDAVKIASMFNEQLTLTGIILTRIDGDARGGAALSMKYITGCPIKFLGVGEKISEFEEFHANRIASRILDMGDIVSLVEKAVEAVDKQDAEQMAARLQKGKFDLNDLRKQFKTIKKMGGLTGMLGFLPGLGAIKEKMNGAQIDENLLARQEAIILSMTPYERANPDILNGSRKKRIAAGSGVQVQDVNKLLKSYLQMRDIMKKMAKMDKKTLLKNGMGNIFS